jgi:hypothetical protein
MLAIPLNVTPISTPYMCGYARKCRSKSPQQRSVHGILPTVDRCSQGSRGCIHDAATVLTNTGELFRYEAMCDFDRGHINERERCISSLKRFISYLVIFENGTKISLKE